MSGLLAGRRIVVPETRELDVLAQMLERQGATAIRRPTRLQSWHGCGGSPNIRPTISS